MILDVDALLFSLSPVTALVGTNIYPVLLPQQCPYPAISYRMADLNPREQGASVGGLTAYRLQVDSFGPDYPTARPVFDALYSSLVEDAGFTGAVGSEFVQSTRLVGGSYNFEPEILLVRLSLTVQLLY